MCLKYIEKRQGLHCEYLSQEITLFGAAVWLRHFCAFLPREGQLVGVTTRNGKNRTRMKKPASHALHRIPVFAVS